MVTHTERFSPTTDEELEHLKRSLAERPGLKAWLLVEEDGTLVVCWKEQGPALPPQGRFGAGGNGGNGRTPGWHNGLREFYAERTSPKLVEQFRATLEADGYAATDPWRCPQSGEYTELWGRFQVRFRWRITDGATSDRGERRLLARRGEAPVQDDDGQARGGASVG